jgi:Tfp pilus assembly protein PilN
VIGKQKPSINLASQPFEPMRPILAAGAAATVVLAALLVWLITSSVSEKGRAAEIRRQISVLEKQSQKLAADQTGLAAALRRPENAEVLDRSLFLNSLIYAKGVSWTRLFDDLEKVMPHNVRLISIRPQINSQNDVSLDMVVGADSADPMIRMMMRMESSPRFGATVLHNRMPPSQSDPLLRYRMSVTYNQKL